MRSVGRLGGERVQTMQERVKLGSKKANPKKKKEKLVDG